MIAFMVAAFILIVIPGPDQALITRSAIAGGRRAGLLTMLGGLSGVSIHAGAAALGISALVLASATAFNVLRIAGTIYLLWMGLQTLRAARRTSAASPDHHADAPVGGARHLRQGFLSNALNPKVALFFVTLLPQFIPAHSAVLPRALLLSAIFATIYLIWFGLYVLVIERLGAVLRRPAVRCRIEQVTGVLLLGFGIRLALLQH